MIYSSILAQKFITFAATSNSSRCKNKIKMFISKVLSLTFFLALCYAKDPFSTLPVLISTQLDEEHNYRLPNNTRPVHYDIHLTTNIDKGDFDFTGVVAITLEALENTNNITIQYRQVTINDVKLVNAQTEQEINFDEPTYDEITEHFVVPLKTSLVKGTNYKLTIEYNATLRQDLAGFHRSSYKDDEGKQM